MSQSAGCLGLPSHKFVAMSSKHTSSACSLPARPTFQSCRTPHRPIIQLRCRLVTEELLFQAPGCAVVLLYVLFSLCTPPRQSAKPAFCTAHQPSKPCTPAQPDYRPAPIPKAYPLMQSRFDVQ